MDFKKPLCRLEMHLRLLTVLEVLRMNPKLMQLNSEDLLLFKQSFILLVTVLGIFVGKKHCYHLMELCFTIFLFNYMLL